MKLIYLLLPILVSSCPVGPGVNVHKFYGNRDLLDTYLHAESHRGDESYEKFKSELCEDFYKRAPKTLLGEDINLTPKYFGMKFTYTPNTNPRVIFTFIRIGVSQAGEEMNFPFMHACWDENNSFCRDMIFSERSHYLKDEIIEIRCGFNLLDMVPVN